MMQFLLQQLNSFECEEFASQNLSNAMWAMATMHMDEDEYVDFDLAHKLEGYVCDSISEFIPQAGGVLKTSTHSLSLTLTLLIRMLLLLPLLLLLLLLHWRSPRHPPACVPVLAESSTTRPAEQDNGTTTHHTPSIKAEARAKAWCLIMHAEPSLSIYHITDR